MFIVSQQCYETTKMSFAKPQDRFPTFLNGGRTWQPRTTHSFGQTEKPTLQVYRLQQTSFLGYRKYIKHKRNGEQVSPKLQGDEEMPLSPSLQDQ
jgi:hypothetical protein